MGKGKRQKKTGKKSGSLFLRVFLLVFFCAVAIGVGQQAGRYQELQEQKAVLTAEMQAEKKKQLELENRREYYNSDTYIEQIAREQLGMVKPNEILYINRSE
ncbi:MAG: septum formation initiator family protein [Anaerotignum sp.]|nr:septum formation initiator family protein [Anaerotignum sp.]